jgi:hypothetical protein
MRKIFTVFAALMMAWSMSAASYGILVNGTTYFAGTPTSEYEGFTQYLAHVPVKSGDKVQLCDLDNKAAWAVTLNTSSVEGFTLSDDHYDVTVTGCYDFYIKLKYQQDQLYIGPGSADCGEGVPYNTGGGGDNPGGGDQPGGIDDVNFYAIGWINGADHGEAAYDTFEDEYLFVDGKLTIDCRMGSYIAIKDHMGNFYYSRTETTIADTSVKFEWANGWTGGQKWAIPEGTNYIIMRSGTLKGNIMLERVDKATYDAYKPESGNQAVENVTVGDKARKVFINGQLRILRGDKMFDATGRQL